eukprot:247295-Chlamydomonas_euryale.AAC.1
MLQPRRVAEPVRAAAAAAAAADDRRAGRRRQPAAAGARAAAEAEARRRVQLLLGEQRVGLGGDRGVLLHSGSVARTCGEGRKQMLVRAHVCARAR